MEAARAREETNLRSYVQTFSNVGSFKYLAAFSRPQTTTDQQLCQTYRRHGIFGHGHSKSWGRRGQTHGFQVCSSSCWFRSSLYFGNICGWWTSPLLGPGSISQPGHTPPHLTPTPASVRWQMVLPAYWGGIGGNGSVAGWDLCNVSAEHCRTVHINAAHIQDKYGYGEDTGIIRTNVLVGTEGGRLQGSQCGGEGNWDRVERGKRGDVGRQRRR